MLQRQMIVEGCLAIYMAPCLLPDLASSKGNTDCITQHSSTFYSLLVTPFRRLRALETHLLLVVENTLIAVSQ
jgi:hypothetical protein